MKSVLIILIACVFCFNLEAQGDIVFSVSSMEKPTNDSDVVYDNVEKLIWEKLSAQTRFPVLDGETNTLKTIDNSGVERTESGQAIAATHLVKIKILPFSSSITPLPPKFELIDFKVEGQAALSFEMEIFDVSTGSVVVSEKFTGEKGLIERVSKISPTKMVWSKEEGLHAVNKTKKELEKEKKEFVEKYGNWKTQMESESIGYAINKFDKKFRRLFLPEIVIIKLVEESKGKAQKVLISEGEQLAFGNREKIEVVLTTTVEFEGEKIVREKKIGVLKFLEVDGSNALCKVADGKEEIYSALNNGQKLTCIVD